MPYDKIKVGNLIHYMGNLREYYRNVAEVLSIDKTFDDKDSFVLKVTDWNKKDHEFRAYGYGNEIWPITLDPQHLIKLGFTKAEDKNVFSMGILTLIRPMFYTRKVNSEHWNDMGFVVIEKPIKLNFTVEEIKENTTPVTSVHTLQNYFADKLHKEMDWNILK